MVSDVEPQGGASCWISEREYTPIWYVQSVVSNSMYPEPLMRSECPSKGTAATIGYTLGVTRTHATEPHPRGIPKATAADSFRGAGLMPVGAP